MFNKRSLFAFLCLVVGWPVSAIAVEPITVPARVIRNIWIVEATISGRSGYLMVDSGANRTCLLADELLPEGNRGVEIKIGGFKNKVEAYVGNLSLLGWIQTKVREWDSKRPVIGILGMDILSKHAVGFDYEKAEMTIWPEGKVESASAQTWVAQSLGAEKPMRMELAKQLDNRLGIQIAFGNTKGWLMLDTGTSLTSLLPGFARGIGVTTHRQDVQFGLGIEQSDMRIVKEATLGTLNVPWLQFQVSNMGSEVPGKPDGALSMIDFRSRRVLIDFPARAVHCAPDEKNRSLSQALSNLVYIPMSVDGDRIYIGTVRSYHLPAFKLVESKPVVSIAGRQAKEIAEALLGKGENPTGFLKDLVAAVQTKFVITVMKDGHPLDITIHTGINSEPTGP